MQSDIKNNANIVLDSATRRRLASVLNVSSTGPSSPQQECIEEGTYRAQRNSIKGAPVCCCFKTKNDNNYSGRVMYNIMFTSVTAFEVTQ